MTSSSYAVRGSITLALALAASACGSTPNASRESEASVGSIHAAITVAGDRHDVTAVDFKVVAAKSACTSAALADTTVALEPDTLPASALPTGAGPHAGADGFLVLPPGDYRVCVTPLAGLVPSADCASTEGTASVVASATTQVLLISQCGGTNGGLDGIAALNNVPVIDTLSVLPSKFITQCQTAHLSASASDADGDALTYSWSVLASPTGSAPRILPKGALADFSTDTAGDYELQVTATDTNAGVSSLSFPIHVAAATCDLPPAISFDHAFDAGATTQAACDEWDGFRGKVSSGTFHTVTMSGSLDSTAITCSVPALATRICNAVALGTADSIACDGHNWNVGSCGIETRDGASTPATELTIDDPICGCADSAHGVRPCLNVPNGSQNWGGFGSPSCPAVAQTLHVSCQ